MCKKVLFGVMACLVMQSCVSSYDSVYNAVYDVKLISVESPKDAKVPYGARIVCDVDNMVRDVYEDDYIRIYWDVSSKYLRFNLRNKTNYTLKINWDDISYVDEYGFTGNIIHSGVKYVDKNKPQSSISVPRGASVCDVLVPVDNIVYVNGQWIESELVKSSYKNLEEFETLKERNVGLYIQILFPVLIENVQNDYIFNFKINDIKRASNDECNSDYKINEGLTKHQDIYYNNF